MGRPISYDIVSDYDKIHNMIHSKTCCVTNLMNGITKRYSTEFILQNLLDEDCITYETNHLWRRKYADLDIYIDREDGQQFWARIQWERKK